MITITDSAHIKRKRIIIILLLIEMVLFLIMCAIFAGTRLNIDLFNMKQIIDLHGPLLNQQNYRPYSDYVGISLSVSIIFTFLAYAVATCWVRCPGCKSIIVKWTPSLDYNVFICTRCDIKINTRIKNE